MSIFFNMQRDSEGKRKVIDYLSREYGGVGINLLEFLSKSAIVCGAENMSKRDVIGLLAERIARFEKKATAAAIAEAVIDREELGSTVVEGRIAFPHARTEQVTGLHIGVATSKDGFDFGDEGRVKLVFLLVANDEFASVYLLALAALARIVRNPEHLKRILEAKTPDEVCLAVGGPGDFFRADLTAGEIMRTPKVLLDPDTPLANIGYVFDESEMECAFVVGKDGRLLGEVSDLDLLRVSAVDLFASSMPGTVVLVKDAMHKGTPSVQKGDKVAEAAMKMIDLRRNRIAVVDEDTKFIGEVVWSDILGKMMAK